MGSIKSRCNWLLILPTVLMVFIGFLLLVPAVMLYDSPKASHIPYLPAIFWMMLLVSPVGLLTLLVSLYLARVRGESWLWLNIIIAGIYVALFLVTCRLAGIRV